MKVYELIKLLDQCDPDLQVVASVHDIHFATTKMYPIVNVHMDKSNDVGFEKYISIDAKSE